MQTWVAEKVINSEMEGQNINIRHSNKVVKLENREAVISTIFKWKI